MDVGSKLLPWVSKPQAYNMRTDTGRCFKATYSVLPINDIMKHAVIRCEDIPSH